MSDVGFSMEFLLSINFALDLAGPESLNNGRNTIQKRILVLNFFDALIQSIADIGKAFLKGLLCATGHFVAHQNADLINLRPFAVQ